MVSPSATTTTGGSAAITAAAGWKTSNAKSAGTAPVRRTLPLCTALPRRAGTFVPSLRQRLEQFVRSIRRNDDLRDQARRLRRVTEADAPHRGAWRGAHVDEDPGQVDGNHGFLDHVPAPLQRLEAIGHAAGMAADAGERRERRGEDGAAPCGAGWRLAHGCVKRGHRWRQATPQPSGWEHRAVH